MLNTYCNSTFDIQHSAFSRSDRSSDLQIIERHDHQGLIILRRPVARELPDRAKQCPLDLLGVQMSVLQDRFLEPVEAIRLAVVVDRFDQAVAIENEAIAGLEVDGVLAERVAAFDAERETPR